MANPFGKIRLFYNETALELKKSSWPTWKELQQLTVIVIVAVALLGLYVSIADFALFNVVDLVTGWVVPQ